MILLCHLFLVIKGELTANELLEVLSSKPALCPIHCNGFLSGEYMGRLVNGSEHVS